MSCSAFDGVVNDPWSMSIRNVRSRVPAVAASCCQACSTATSRSGVLSSTADTTVVSARGTTAGNSESS